jgi:RNA polymerase sigma factor (sigma-70 family)
VRSRNAAGVPTQKATLMPCRKTAGRVTNSGLAVAACPLAASAAPVPASAKAEYHRVRGLLPDIAKEPLSLETPVGEEDDLQLGDFIEDENAVSPIDATIQSDLRDATTRALASLSQREERIIRMRFGIELSADRTLAEVGQQFAVSRERIRQIEAKALRKLRHPHRSKMLRSFIDN